MDSPDGPFCFHDENKTKNWGVKRTATFTVGGRGENFFRLGLQMPPMRADTHTLKLQVNPSTSPCPRLPLPVWKTPLGSSPSPPTLSATGATQGGRDQRLARRVATAPEERWPKGTRWHLPRLARLRVRTPSAVVLSPLTEVVFSTAFMFSCSAASSAYCSPWGWLWHGGELLENLPDCGRGKTRICCFNRKRDGE